MSTTISAVFIQFAAVILPLLGINVGTEALTTTVQTIVLVGTGLYIWYARTLRGDVSKFGARLK